MARDVGGLVVGMQLLEPGFSVAPQRSVRVGRLLVDAHPAIDAALDRALRASEWELSDLELPEWDAISASAGLLLVREAWESDAGVATRHPDKVGQDVLGRLRIGAAVDGGTIETARATVQAWRDRVEAVFSAVDVIATPTLTVFPPRLGQGEELLVARCTIPVNAAGVPAVVLPVPADAPVPASIQLIGPSGSEERLLAAALQLEAAIATLSSA
jgi:amidase